MTESTTGDEGASGGQVDVETEHPESSRGGGRKRQRDGGLCAGAVKRIAAIACGMMDETHVQMCGGVPVIVGAKRGRSVEQAGQQSSGRGGAVEHARSERERRAERRNEVRRADGNGKRREVAKCSEFEWRGVPRKASRSDEAKEGDTDS